MSDILEVRIQRSSSCGAMRWGIRHAGTDRRLDSGFDQLEKALSFAERQGWRVIGKYARAVEA